jgi:hypothetical protein
MLARRQKSCCELTEKLFARSRAAVAVPRMGKLATHAPPRRVGGGRSVRYDERHAAGGHTHVHAAEWSDSAAAAVMAVLHTCKGAAQQTLMEYTAGMLASDASVRDFVRTSCRHMSVGDRALAEEIMLLHSSRLQQAPADQALKKARSFLKPLRERNSVRQAPAALDLVAARPGPTSLVKLLSAKPEADRLRDIGKCKRITDGLRGWPLGWLRGRGIVCYERAHGRVRAERAGRPDAAFLKGVVKQKVLPTAVASDSDHYVVVGGGKEPRFMSVQEVARGFGVPAVGPLMKMLKGEKPLSPNQAVACLGRSVHVKSAARIVDTLLERGVLARGLSYGSAFSGIDTFAAAVELATGGAWSYAFASESDKVPRAGLLAAWGCRGLAAERCYADATEGEALTAQAVDLFVITANCEAHSRRNHHQSAEDQRASVEDVWASLGYVRHARPRAVVMENVSEPSTVGALTGLLARLEGYTVETGVLDPATDGGAPMTRERQFWVLTRT